MSAYGPNAPRHGPILPPKLFQLPSSTSIAVQHSQTAKTVSVHHLISTTIPATLAQFLYTAFQEELERGRTYPQEYPMTRAGFDAYFLANDCFVGILHVSEQPVDLTAEDLSLEDARADRDWNKCVAGAYYVKPNYPGRSSHICNAGFLVPPYFRQMGIATALARSYVENAPRLGYKASVFNLVYVNNEASVRTWDRLGFTKIGRIPKAGRLKRTEEDGGGEDYVDAWIMYKSFEVETQADV